MENQYRRGCVNEQTKRKFTILFTNVELEALLSGAADSKRATYRMDWSGWGRFCSVRNISVWLEPGVPGRDGRLVDYLILTSKVLGRNASTLRARFSAIRFTRLINGHVDFALQSHRAKAMIKGMRKREVTVRKHPPNTDLLRWTHKELICKSDGRTIGHGSSYTEMYTACFLGFLFLLRTSEIAALTWGAISVDTHENQRFGDKNKRVEN